MDVGDVGQGFVDLAGPRGERRDGLLGDGDPLHALLPAGGARRGQVEVGDDEGLAELRPAREDRPVLADDEGVAVEDEFVLPADGVDVGDGAPGLRGAARDEFEADVVLVALVGGAVDDGEQPAPASSAVCTGPPSCHRSSQIAMATSTPRTRATSRSSPGVKMRYSSKTP